MHRKKLDSKTRSFYDNIYYKNISAKRKIHRHYKKLVSKIYLKKDDSILDIACGTGEWLKVATLNGAMPFGIDISEKAVQASKNWIQTGGFAVCVSENLPFTGHSFDVVTCLGALEHFQDQKKALKEMIRVAKKNASFLILVPNSNFLTYRLGLFKGTKQTEVKETIMSLEEWERLFFEAGLIVDKKWKDLHVISTDWIIRRPWLMIPFRFLQAILLAVWPLNWQYQVYHLCYHNDD